MVDNLFFSRCCSSSTMSLRYSSSWIRRLAISRSLCGDRAIVLDPPDREAAGRQKDRQQRQPCQVRRVFAEIDAHAERATGQRRHDSEPVTAERSGKDHGRKIRGEEHVRPDQRKAPARRGRQGRQATANPMLKSGEGWEIPCQPSRNSSINFAIGHISRSAQSKIWPSIPEIPGLDAAKIADRPMAHTSACVVRQGCDDRPKQEREEA